MNVMFEISPLVSIIIPFFNSEKYIHRCMDSIIEQTYANIEVICVNDGSEDSSLEIVKNYHDERIKIINQKNMGPGTARNTGLDACTGDYILFMDSDDYLHPDMIKDMIAQIIAQNGSIVMCKSYEFKDGEHETRPLKNTLLTDCIDSDIFTFEDLGDKAFQFAVGWNWDKIYSSELLKSNEIRFPNLRNSEDFMVVYPAMIRSDRICYVDKHLVYHRVGNRESTSRTRKNEPLAFIDGCTLLKNFLDDNGLFLGDLERSYINWVLDYALWNMDTLDFYSKVKVFRRLKRKGLRDCGITTEYKESYFFIPHHYKRLLGIEKIPIHIFAFRVALDYCFKNGLRSVLKKLLRK